jgi:putative sterol carrier protein
MNAQSAQAYVQKWFSVFERVQKDPTTLETLKGVSMTLVLSFTDLKDAVFSVVIDNGKVSHQAGEIPGYESKISIASSDFEGLVTETLSPMMAIQQGLIEIDGELGPLLNLSYLMAPMKEHWLALSQE